MSEHHHSHLPLPSGHRATARSSRPTRRRLAGTAALGLTGALAAALAVQGLLPAGAATAPAPAPLRVAVVGDSIAWGQGLAEPHKFATTVGAWLQSRTGRPVTVTTVAHSGATLAGACPAPGLVLPGEVPSPAPSVACQLATAAATAKAAGSGVDLVLLSGCVNELGVQALLTGTGIPAGASVRDLVRSRCAAPLAAAVAAARALPGAPKVVLTGYYPPVSRQTDPARLWTAAGNAPVTPATLPAARALVLRASRLGHQFSAAFDALAEQTVARANRRGAPAVAYASPRLRPDQALFAPHSLLWNGADDEVAAGRAAVCATLPGLSDAARAQCALASIGHPNVAGAARYAEQVERAVDGSGWLARRGWSHRR